MNRILMVFCVAILCAVKVLAQPADTLYWVVETNLNNRTYSIIHVYNQRNQKVHEVKMLGVYLDITNAKHRKKLDILLQQYTEKRTAVSSRRKKTKNTI